MFQFGGLEALFGGAKPPPRGGGTGSTSHDPQKATFVVLERALNGNMLPICRVWNRCVASVVSRESAVAWWDGSSV